VKPLMHILYPCLPCYTVTLLDLGSDKCLALLRLVAVGDFLSLATIGGY
jgi:energy-converting hydrogenase Eha subunit E